MRLVLLEETLSKMESVNADDYTEDDVGWFLVKQIKPSKTKWTDFINDKYAWLTLAKM